MKYAPYGKTSAARMNAYDAVWDAGWLTESAEMNAHIWRSVTAALDAYEQTTS